ncbi:DNA polymerase III subunit beta [Lebetimonas natsushimae]|uniref:Beta sliding clamp n=1 Tax=Lebetimonas natsushimae TaxID=1936991 RepID=A0A292YB44_9BACT|nr:DNA polymerase III subunit beta [Lebetimonas natsushimae]GAX86749.1 DNA polymerase III subunit beta [Lebetimonas natsushimae]
MHIKIEKPLIESILSNVQGFTEKKDNTQITSHILINADDKLTIKATDKEIGIKITTDCEIIKKGKITINAKKFNDIIKALKNKEIEIYSQNNKIVIKQDTSIYQLISFDPNQFPEFPDTNDLEEINVNIEEFQDAIKKIYPVIDNNNPKYELNGALFDLKEKSNFVSTDTRRLAIYYSNAKAKENKIIVPKRSLAEIKRIIRDDMKIFYDDVYLILENDSTFFFTKLINGKFPAYEKIIPQQLKYELEIDKNEFLSHLKQISIISNEVKISIKNNLIEFESISEESMQAKTSFEINSDIEQFTFAVNSKYIIDFLAVIDTDTFTLGINEPNIPFVLKSENFLTIVMPLNI